MLIIAIDGTAGSGKSTLARQIASRLGYQYIDSGAMYRAVGWTAIEGGIRLDDEEALAELVRTISIEMLDLDGKLKVLVDGRDVSEGIRTPEASAASSAVATIPAVRTAMVEQQRRMGKPGGVVMEGRDIGTVVFPNADVKFFLNAQDDVRARRRQNQQQDQGVEQPFEKVVEELVSRDQRDSTRAESPLQRADDAILIDTSEGSIEDLVRLMLSIISNKTEINMNE